MHCIADGHLDGATISDFTLHLASDALCNDCSIEVGLLHFEDINLNVLVGDFLEFFLELVNFLTTLTDDNTGARGADCDGDELRGTFDDDACHAGLGQTSVEVFADFAILKEVVTEVVASVPVGIPAAYDTQTITNRIYFLSHSL